MARHRIEPLVGFWWHDIYWSMICVLACAATQVKFLMNAITFMRMWLSDVCPCSRQAPREMLLEIFRIVLSIIKCMRKGYVCQVEAAT
jgi:hypothetical protein